MRRVRLLVHDGRAQAHSHSHTTGAPSRVDRRQEVRPQSQAHHTRTYALGSPPITYTPFAARTQVRGEAEPVRAANFQPDKNR